MKTLFAIALFLGSMPLFAYDPTLAINVQKVSSLLSRAEKRGINPAGIACYVELRRIEDGYYTLYTASENDQLFIGLDIEAYGKIQSKWTKRSFTLLQRGFEGVQELNIREEFSTRHLAVHSKESVNGQSSETICYLPLK